MVPIRGDVIPNPTSEYSGPLLVILSIYINLPIPPYLWLGFRSRKTFAAHLIGLSHVDCLVENNTTNQIPNEICNGCL